MNCFFCGSSNIRLPLIGISLGMAGDDYSFCEKCLKGMNADDFWKEFFNKLKYDYPPKLKNRDQ